MFVKNKELTSSFQKNKVVEIRIPFLVFVIHSLTFPVHTHTHTHMLLYTQKIVVLERKW